MTDSCDRLEDLRAEYANTGCVTSDGAVWLISQVAVLREQVQHLKQPAAAPPADRAALRDRIAKALADEDGRTCGWGHGFLDRYGADRETDGFVDAVLAVLPAPADRAAVLREAADELGRMDYDTDSNDYGYDTYRDAWNGGVMDGAGLLRRMAAEAQPTGQHQPRRDDAFEAWLKAQRDDHNSHGTNDHEMYDAIDALLDQYQLHADTGTPLGEHVCEGRAVGDCEHLEPAAGAEQGGEA